MAEYKYFIIWTSFYYVALDYREIETLQSSLSVCATI